MTKGSVAASSSSAAAAPKSTAERLAEMRANEKKGPFTRVHRSTLPRRIIVTKENEDEQKALCTVVTLHGVRRVEKLKHVEKRSGMLRGSTATRIMIARHMHVLIAQISAAAAEFMAYRNASTMTPADVAHGYHHVTGRIVFGKDAPVLPFTKSVKGKAPSRAKKNAAETSSIVGAGAI